MGAALKRLFTQPEKGPPVPFFLYDFGLLALYLLPWTPLLLLAWPLHRAREKKEIYRRRAWGGIPLEPSLDQLLERYFAIAAVVSLGGLLLIQNQQHEYLLFVLIPFALAGACAVGKLNQPGGIPEERLAWLYLLGGGVAGLAVLTSPFWIKPEWVRLDSIPLMYAAPLGLALLVAGWFASRQAVEGQVLQHGAWLAGVSLALWTCLSIGWEIPRLNKPIIINNGIIFLPDSKLMLPQIPGAPVTPAPGPTPAPANP
jgi:hypothetical protein